MNEKEKQIIKNIARVLPILDESKKNYLLGLGEGMVLMKNSKAEKEVS